MVKEVLLRFEINGNSFKDGNLLLYDKKGQYFYAVTPEMFLNRQDARIDELKKKYDEKEKSMRKEVESCKQEVLELKQTYNSFLNDYKISNEKLINMVESFVNKYGGKE